MRPRNGLIGMVKIALRFSMFSPHGLQRIPAARFGRRHHFTFAEPARATALTLADDARLFLTTFVGGLLFMTIYLG
jgi:hypothetical protein